MNRVIDDCLSTGWGNPRRLESVHQWTTLPAPLLWWGRRDSNPHALRHMILSHARLPVPTLPPQIPATLLIIPSLLPQCIRAPEGSVRLIAMVGTPASQIPSPPFFLSTSRHPHTLTSSPHKLTSFSHPPRRPREPPPSLPHQPRRPRTHPVIPAYAGMTPLTSDARLERIPQTPMRARYEWARW